MRRLESSGRLLAVWGVVALLLVLTALTGCAVQATHPVDSSIAFALGGAFIAAGFASVMFSYGVFVDYWKMVLQFAAIAAMLFLAGCAALPMPLQPRGENNSNMAEGAFLVLAATDTVQTMHIRKGTSCDHEADPMAAALYGSRYPKPGRVLLTNLALMTVHTMVASWLDDEVESHKTADSAGLWYTGRLAFHAISIVAEGSAVVSNASRGCKL